MWEMVELSLRHHTEIKHGIVLPQTQGVDVGGRGAIGIREVFYTGTEVGGLPGRRITGKEKQPRETERTLHVLALEVERGNYTGGTRTTAKMRSLRGAYISITAD